MAERIRFIEHAGKRVLLIDFSQATKQEIMPLLDEIQETISAEAPSSVLTLADFDQAEIDKEVSGRMKEVLVFDRPFVKRSAWVATESLPKVFYENIKSFSRREFPIFKTRDEALDWLVGGD